MGKLTDRYSSKFVTMGGRSIASGGSGWTPLTEDEIASIEAASGLSLPDEYRAFLAEFGSVVFRKKVSYRTMQSIPSAPGGTEPFDGFYGAESEGGWSLRNQMYTLKGRIPNSLIPIGENMFGDRICLGITDVDRGRVYFWDHDDERSEYDYRQLHGHDAQVPRKWMFANVYLAGSSFCDFLDRLELDP